MKKLLVLLMLIGICGCFKENEEDVFSASSGSIVNYPVTYRVAPKAGTDVTHDTAATVVLTSDECRGTVRINGDDDVIDYTLPPVIDGLVISIANVLYDQVITVDVDAGDADKIVMNDGTVLDAGDAVDSPALKTAKATFLGYDDGAGNTYWIMFSIQETWVDGGAD